MILFLKEEFPGQASISSVSRAVSKESSIISAGGFLIAFQDYSCFVVHANEHPTILSVYLFEYVPKCKPLTFVSV